ncbi:hypothetical protein PENANT_c011G03959 [Penicillium antarcticum]|uniref:HhH-GPD domain-containing protein n=1 Tax=Penicillium antarcticum TaxID=416450 RepID=A0A1V6Q7D5_9EURO|nr:hypothetical protein PENANT_c011G03959 [Penicillium antarcticum]
MSKETTQKINQVINDFGRSPLHDTPLSNTLTASPDIVLAMTIDALIKARPISHGLAQRTINKLIEAGYHDINILSNSSWEDRVSVLAEGGYNRYREQYGDLNNLLHQASFNRDEAGILMKEIKGVGDLAVEVFFNNVQSVWPCIAPFVDSRSLKTAVYVGIGEDLDYIYKVLEEDPVRMSWFANGLSEVRLEKKQDVI